MPDTQPHMFMVPPETFTELTTVSLPRVRQTMCSKIKKLHDASSYQAAEYLRVQQGQKKEVALKEQAER